MFLCTIIISWVVIIVIILRTRAIGGPLPEEYIVGKATLIWKSKNRVTDEIRMDRIFKKDKVV